MESFPKDGERQDKARASVLAQRMAHDDLAINSGVAMNTIDGLIGSGLSRIIAYNRAADIAKALGLPPTLSADVVRRWAAGEVIHLA